MEEMLLSMPLWAYIIGAVLVGMAFTKVGFSLREKGEIAQAREAAFQTGERARLNLLTTALTVNEVRALEDLGAVRQPEGFNPFGNTVTPPPISLTQKRCAYCGRESRPDPSGACPNCAGRKWVSV